MLIKKKTKNHPNTYTNKKHVYLQVKLADSFREKWHKTHPQPSIPSNRHPFSNWYGYPSSCNNKCEKVSYRKSVKMFAGRLTSAAIIFFILLLIILACSCFCCYSGFFTACRFLSCIVPKRRLCRLLINCQSCLSPLPSMGRIGCTQLLRQFPRHGDKLLPHQIPYYHAR